MSGGTRDEAAEERHIHRAHSAEIFLRPSPTVRVAGSHDRCGA